MAVSSNPANCAGILATWHILENVRTNPNTDIKASTYGLLTKHMICFLDGVYNHKSEKYRIYDVGLEIVKWGFKRKLPLLNTFWCANAIDEN